MSERCGFIRACSGRDITFRFDIGGLMKLKVHAKNRSFEVPADGGPNLLMAGLAAGLELPYACATGTCGSCKARLVSGEVTDHWPAALGKAKCKSDTNEVLLCQCAAIGDCDIEIAEHVYEVDPGARTPRRYAGAVTRWAMLTADVAIWDIRLDNSMEFDAGQFALVSVDGVAGHRAYSMVNFDRGTRTLTFLTKKKPGGVLTEHLFNGSPEGQKLSVIGPLGRAIFRPSLRKNLLCIAGGSGIAGIMSILSRATRERYFSQHKGRVFFGVRTLQDAFFLDELTTYARQFESTLEITIGISEGQVSDHMVSQYPFLKFSTGLIHEIAAQAVKGNTSNTQIYLAGPTPLVDAAIRHLLIVEKVDAKNIAYDKFS